MKNEANEALKKEWIAALIKSVKNMDWWERKQKAFANRGVKVLRANGDGQIYRDLVPNERTNVIEYGIHFSFLLRQNDHVFMEEQLVHLSARFEENKLVEHSVVSNNVNQGREGQFTPERSHNEEFHSRSFEYDRRKAVQYAERWWNDFNPKYYQFEKDCTNYVSQCLHAGGAPMWGFPSRSKGWWIRGDNWSYSWSVAHSFRWYLSSSDKGLMAQEVTDAKDLLPGDVICYDFEGDGNWNHTAIVVAKDGRGEPLVNAHSDNSRNRHWSYEDSYAWTTKTSYKFFKIKG
ncbi:amidase domain-containing protein [Salirhabdus salicampi]|uniref:amidase domain-containing protein n=1 Tax=Salirhabdus salicampi TaxID=476102 RepID=UPI0020C3FA8C|nr:amidase domain-containing protein [Salirhabdus salicampi]MCP8615293.1 amidase domain-containing protein [Salirhabdus salicampi]